MTGRIGHIAVILVLIVSGCANRKGTEQVQATPAPKPAWVTQRPFAPSEYIGVSAVSKAQYPLDYQQVAKKNALNDLASEISVEVQGETFLNQLEVDRQFRETFISQINTTTQEKIEGYDVGGIWEDANEYWIYYRLSKAKHASIKAEKKRLALTGARDYYLKALDALEQGSTSQSIDLHLNALLEMKPYWAESNPFEVEGREVFLDNEIYHSLRNAVADIRLEPNLPSVVLEQANQYTGRVLISVTRSDRPLRNVPLKFDFDRGKYMRPVEGLTNAEGQLVIEVRDANVSNLHNFLKVWVDIDELVGEVVRDPMLDPVVDKLKAEEVGIPIEVRLPTVFLESSEAVLGNPTNQGNLANAIRNALTQQGFSFTSNPNQADLHIQLEADTRDGGVQRGFYVGLLNMVLTATEMQTGTTVFSKTMQDIKGFQLNLESASNEAYKKAAKKIEKDVAGELVKQIL